jgi:hypothetical protein
LFNLDECQIAKSLALDRLDNLAVGIHESNPLVEHTIGREQTTARYWELARLTPADTNGSLTSQLRALESLCEMLGLLAPKAGEQPKSQAPPDIYRAEWMRKPDQTGT